MEDIKEKIVSAIFEAAGVGAPRGTDWLWDEFDEDLTLTVQGIQFDVKRIGQMMDPIGSDFRQELYSMFGNAIVDGKKYYVFWVHLADYGVSHAFFHVFDTVDQIKNEIWNDPLHKASYEDILEIFPEELRP